MSYKDSKEGLKEHFFNLVVLLVPSRMGSHIDGDDVGNMKITDRDKLGGVVGRRSSSSVAASHSQRTSWTPSFSVWMGESGLLSIRIGCCYPVLLLSLMPVTVFDAYYLMTHHPTTSYDVFPLPCIFLMYIWRL